MSKLFDIEYRFPAYSITRVKAKDIDEAEQIFHEEIGADFEPEELDLVEVMSIVPTQEEVN